MDRTISTECMVDWNSGKTTYFRSLSIDDIKSLLNNHDIMLYHSQDKIMICLDGKGKRFRQR